MFEGGLLLGQGASLRIVTYHLECFSDACVKYTSISRMLASVALFVTQQSRAFCMSAGALVCAYACAVVL
jgi:hypothetical protein